MEFNKRELIELLMDLDRVKNQITGIQEKLHKISSAKNSESKPTTYVFNENKDDAIW